LLANGHHFYKMWLLQDIGDFRYSAAALASYEDYFDFIDWLADEDVDSPSFGTGVAIRSVQELNPP
jgi:hypothetical protein